MKKGAILVLILCFTLCTNSLALAVPPDFNGGVNNEYEYVELVFVTGQALRFIGEITVTEKDKDDSKTISYKFQLTPEDKSIKGKLDRKITYEIDYDRRSDKGQTIAATKMTSYKETITMDKDKYELEDYQFSKSDVIDNRPASNFSSGTLEGRKYYTINKNQGKLIVDVSGGEVGYDNFWGNTSTQIIEYYYECDRTIPAEGDEESEEVAWQGTVKASVSDSTTKSLRYADNTPVFTSFAGAHMRVTRQELSSIYEYDMPRMNDGIPSSTRRDQNTVSLSRQMVPRIEKLIIPKFRDLGGHWAEDNINQLYSLEVFSGSSNFFAPEVPMSRIDFIRAVVKACDIRPTVSAAKTRVSSKKAPPEVSPYVDLMVGSDDYDYAKAAFQKKIAAGVSENVFAPNDNLTRAQAITILVRALGFENIAPTPGFRTSFVDDREIPIWGVDGIYMAQKMGLISGDHFNRVNPNQSMTKAEASAMLVKFLGFLQNDLQKDYRENIVLYN